MSFFDIVLIVEFMDLPFFPIPKDKRFDKLLHKDEEIVHELDFMRMIHGAADQTENPLDAGPNTFPPSLFCGPE